MASGARPKAVAAALACSAAAGGALLLWKLRGKRRSTELSDTSETSATTTVSSGGCAAGAPGREEGTESEKMRGDIPRSITAPSPPLQNEDHYGANLRSDLSSILRPGTVTVAYVSTTDTCRKLAQSMHRHLTTKILGTGRKSRASSGLIVVQICRVDELDWWDEVLNPDEDEGGADPSSLPPPVVLFILPTWTNGTLPPSSQPLLTSLEEISCDWRVAPNPLRPSGVNVGAFGVGSSAYDTETFCLPAKRVVELMVGSLGARRLGPVGTGDVEMGDYREDFRKWADGVLDKVGQKYGSASLPLVSENAVGCCGGKDEADASCACASEGGAASSFAGAAQDDGCCSKKPGDKADTGDDDDDDDDESYYSDEDDENNEPEIMDLEDIGDAMQSSSTAKRKGKGPPKEMVTPKQAASLKKEGYKLIGTHSAVKLCRWTKHQLRGRGGCYKHTFYGITSYQCMEATPSLACANKCVFCWRHHKNPVGREWRWKTDDPNFIVEEAIKTHIQMIKETKGIPGVRMDRWEEAHTVRHCALSLVGEPIMYPRIDEFLADLHRRQISTFLVTNGQHPQQIDSLRPITQLYVSVDASTPEALEAIDRPLFRDAWDRLRRSLKSLRVKGQRTVARITVVKGWNSDEIAGYARLIALGHCSLVEVKGVTFCGKSDASNLNMSNSPWHHEVVDLCRILRDELNKLHDAGGVDGPPRYELACEHKHSVSVLLARVDQFGYNDPETGKLKWRTWIDYIKFQELAAKAVADPSFTFGPKDYAQETPSWALFGANEEGFDPTDTRHRRKQKHPLYTKFDKCGIPTHDHKGDTITEKEREKMRHMMKDKEKEIGCGSTVTALNSGEMKISDASLMFRGLTIKK